MVFWIESYHLPSFTIIYHHLSIQPGEPIDPETWWPKHVYNYWTPKHSETVQLNWLAHLQISGKKLHGTSNILKHLVLSFRLSSENLMRKKNILLSFCFHVFFLFSILGTSCESGKQHGQQKKTWKPHGNSRTIFVPSSSRWYAQAGSRSPCFRKIWSL